MTLFFHHLPKPLVVVVVGLALVVAGCGGLAGNVDIVATLTPIPTASAVGQDPDYPTSAPNIVAGAQIFAENCTKCHGTGGAGDGELVSSGQVGAMPSFLDATHVRAMRPDEYYDTITNGNLEKLMPPWKDALTAQQRWDVTLYVYTLHYTPDNVALGEALYAQNCAECHGETGLGDGEKQRLIGEDAFDLTSLDMNFIDDGAIVETIKYGKGDSMPAREGELTDDQMWAIAEYVRSFSTTKADTATVADSANPELPAQTIAFTGTIANGSSGGSLPNPMTIRLRYGNQADGIEDVETLLQADGTYRFTDVPRKDGYGYMVYTTYQNLVFSSDVLESQNVTDNNILDFNIYEQTEDPFVVSLTDLYTQFEPFPEVDSDAEALGKGLLVTQKFTYTNQSDRAFVLSQNGVNFSLLVQVPPGAIILNVLQNPRYIVAQEQYSVIDTEPVNPGEHEIELVYFLPYETGAIFDQPLNNALNGTAQIVTNPKSIKVVGEGWTLDDSAPFINQYSQTFTQEASDTLKFELVGDMDASTSANASLITADLFVPLLAVIVIIITLGILIYSQLKRRNNPSDEIQLLLRQIAELDGLHDKGQINHDAYQRQRQTLKLRLTTLMASQGASEAKDAPK